MDIAEAMKVFDGLGVDDVPPQAACKYAAMEVRYAMEKTEFHYIDAAILEQAVEILTKRADG